jgi:hypothetical protein
MFSLKPNTSAACIQVWHILFESPIHATVRPEIVAAPLDPGIDVGQHLAGVVFVGQTIDDRHPRIGRKALDDGSVR